jgi:hypothetical protein
VVEELSLRLTVKALIAAASEVVPINMDPPPILSCLMVVVNASLEMDTVKRIAHGLSVSAPKSVDPIRIYDISGRYAAHISLATKYHRLQGLSTAY